MGMCRYDENVKQLDFRYCQQFDWHVEKPLGVFSDT